MKHILHFYNYKTVLVSKSKQNKDLLELAYGYLRDTKYEQHEDIVKYKIADKRCRFVYKTELDEKVYYIKKYVNRSVVKFIIDRFRTQRSVRSMFTFWFLKAKGIPTYEQLFALIDKRRFFNRPSIIVSKECNGQTIKQLLQKEISPQEKSEIIEKWIELYVKLLRNNIYHHDPNLSNFIIEDNELKLIDLDDVFILPKISKRLLKKNLKKFNKILFLAHAREKNGNIDFDNNDRKFILKEILLRYNKNISKKEFMNFLNRKTKIPVFEIDKLVKAH